MKLHNQAIPIEISTFLDISEIESIYLCKELKGLGFACFNTKRTCLGPLLKDLVRHNGLSILPPWPRILTPTSWPHIHDLW